MKLSLYNICEYLAREGVSMSGEAYIDDANICGLRVRRSGELMNERYVYLSKSENLPDSVTLQHSGERLLLSDIAMEDAVNLLSACFEHYNNWEQALNEALDSEEPLDAMLSACLGVLDYPILVVRNDTRLIAANNYTADNMPQSVKEFVEEAIRAGFFPMGNTKAAADDDRAHLYYTTKEVLRLKSYFHQHYYLRTNLWVDGRREGMVFAFGAENDFLPGEYALFKLLTEKIEAALSLYKSRYLSDSLFSAFISQSLQNGFIDEEKLSYMLAAFGFGADDEYLLIKLEYKFLAVTQPYAYLMRIGERLQTELKHCCLMNMNAQILLLLNVGAFGGLELLIKRLLEFDEIDSCYVALSMPFWGAKNMLIYLQQVDRVLGYAKQPEFAKRIVKADDVIFEELRSASADSGLYCYIHPDILRLSSSDERSKTNYLYTLFCYLLCACNLTDAANLMNIHRNTMKYRIGKITEMLTLNPDEPRDRLLLLSSILLGGIPNDRENISQI